MPRRNVFQSDHSLIRNGSLVTVTVQCDNMPSRTTEIGSPEDQPFDASTQSRICRGLVHALEKGLAIGSAVSLASATLAHKF